MEPTKIKCPACQGDGLVRVPGTVSPIDLAGVLKNYMPCICEDGAEFVKDFPGSELIR